MKKIRKYTFAGLAAILFFLIILPCTVSAATPLSAHGRLSVKGAKLVDAKGKEFQLKGVSTHGLSWFPEYVSKEAFQDLRDCWGANAVRLAMYTAEYNGYCTGDAGNRKALKKLIHTGVEAASDLGMYVIIDWHILSDGNPNTYKKESVTFFKEMAKKYKSHKNVIYEICNEPNGGTDWKHIKSYAESVIKEIRRIDKHAVILVGTPNWSQDVDTAAENPLKGYKNIMYTLHFYADTHREAYREKAKRALEAGLPLFVSEFGICDASGNGAVNQTEADKWMKLLNTYGVSYMAWNLSNKAESSSLLKSSCRKKSGWTESDLSKSGKWLVSTLKGKLGGTSNVKPGGKPKPGSQAKPSNPKPAGVKSAKKSCRANVKRDGLWQDGERWYALYRVSLSNRGKKAVSRWKVRVTFKYSVKKSQQWNGTCTCQGKSVIISPVSWNKKIPAKAKVDGIGFVVSSSRKDNKVISVKVL
ncbi:cellulase family glycosylhydrolase [Lachnospiraceae bacterium 46-15]